MCRSVSHRLELMSQVRESTNGKGGGGGFLHIPAPDLIFHNVPIHPSCPYYDSELFTLFLCHDLGSQHCSEV